VCGDFLEKQFSVVSSQLSVKTTVSTSFWSVFQKCLEYSFCVSSGAKARADIATFSAVWAKALTY
jgi:hypothetical protein